MTQSALEQNPDIHFINTDTEGAIESARINKVDVGVLL